MVRHDSFIIFLLLICLMLLTVEGNDKDIASCIRNCAQCKKMFSIYFNGELCENTCRQLKGTFNPDCEDANSIEPFLIPNPKKREIAWK